MPSFLLLPASFLFITATCTQRISCLMFCFPDSLFLSFFLSLSIVLCLIGKSKVLRAGLDPDSLYLSLVLDSFQSLFSSHTWFFSFSCCLFPSFSLLSSVLLCSVFFLVCFLESNGVLVLICLHVFP